MPAPDQIPSPWSLVWQWPDKSSRIPLWRPCWHFFAGCASLVITSNLIATILGEEAIGCALISLVFGMFFVLLGVAFWAIVRRPHLRRPARQFSLLALFMATAVSAPYLILVRGLAELGDAEAPQGSTLIRSAIGVALFGVAGVPALLSWMSSLVWFAAWLAGPRKTHRHLQQRERADGES